MPTAGPLGEDQSAVHRYLEYTTGGLDQAHLRLGEGLPQLGRQTGGPGLIVSNDAVFEGDLHDEHRLGEPRTGAIGRQSAR